MFKGEKKGSKMFSKLSLSSCEEESIISAMVRMEIVLVVTILSSLVSLHHW